MFSGDIRDDLYPAHRVDDKTPDQPDEQWTLMATTQKSYRVSIQREQKNEAKTCSLYNLPDQLIVLVLYNTIQLKFQ